MKIHSYSAVSHADDDFIVVGLTYREQDEISYALMNSFGEDSEEYKRWQEMVLSGKLSSLKE